MQIKINESAKFYFYTLIMFIVLGFAYVTNWIYNYPLNECPYCVQFEAYRKSKEFIELIFSIHWIIIPISIVFGLYKKR